MRIADKKNALSAIKQNNLALHKLISVLPKQTEQMTPKQRRSKFKLTDCSPLLISEFSQPTDNSKRKICSIGGIVPSKSKVSIQNYATEKISHSIEKVKADTEARSIIVMPNRKILSELSSNSDLIRIVRPKKIVQVRKELFFDPFTQTDENGVLNPDSRVKPTAEQQEMANSYKYQQKEFKRDLIRNIRHTNKLGMINQKDNSDDSEEEQRIIISNKKQQ